MYSSPHIIRLINSMSMGYRRVQGDACLLGKAGCRQKHVVKIDLKDRIQLA
jgi:hypothetical protein